MFDVVRRRQHLWLLNLSCWSAVMMQLVALNLEFQQFLRILYLASYLFEYDCCCFRDFDLHVPAFGAHTCFWRGCCG